MKSKTWTYIMIVLVTFLAGEIKIIPFGEAFRVALGSAAFFFLILWFRHVSAFMAGFLTGLFVPVFRIGLDMMFQQPFFWQQSFEAHSPAFFYYLLFGFFLSLLDLDRPDVNPFKLGVTGALSDFVANLGELIARSFISDIPLNIEEFLTILIVGIIRSFFVVGLYSNIHLKGIRMIHEEKEKRMLKLLSIGSGLYQETLYLQKSMADIEQITRQSYELYQSLKKKVEKSPDPEQWEPMIRQSLHVAQEVHEVKKNTQRILAGLLKMFKKESLSGKMHIKDIMNFAIKSNQNYADMLGKKIKFDSLVSVNLETIHYYPLLSVINNILANAVEAIDYTGDISVRVRELTNHRLEFRIEDTGSGIAPHDYDVIFHPGFTTKYDQAGVAATGIGLSHVKEIVESLKGDVFVKPASGESGTVFVVNIPRNELEKEGNG
ncbi:MAG: GHKL domain-containing protein [Bacillaceae bacterium]|nr:GHKL domain-containing protein [Bacillaceae bacterium]